MTHQASNQAVKINLIELPDTGALAFNLESDIEVQAVQKNLFGLLKYKAADYVQFRHLSLPATRSYLEAFSRQQLDQQTGLSAALRCGSLIGRLACQLGRECRFPRCGRAHSRASCRAGKRLSEEKFS